MRRERWGRDEIEVFDEWDVRETGLRKEEKSEREIMQKGLDMMPISLMVLCPPSSSLTKQ